MTAVSDGELPQKTAVHCTGRQKGGQVWVLSKDLHINEDGSIIPAAESQFVWIETLLNSQQASSAVARKKVRKPVQNLISAFQECYRENFPATLLTLGAQVYITTFVYAHFIMTIIIIMHVTILFC